MPTGPATSQGGSRLDRELAAHAERICRQSIHETRMLGRHLAHALAGDPGIDAIGTQLVAPGIQILKRESARLEALQAAADNQEFDLYVGLFEPILELAEQRLEAGQQGEPERGQSLERLIAGLGDAQVTIAAELGLQACRTSFTEALGGRT